MTSHIEGGFLRASFYPSPYDGQDEDHSGELLAPSERRRRDPDRQGDGRRRRDQPALLVGRLIDRGDSGFALSDDDAVSDSGSGRAIADLVTPEEDRWTARGGAGEDTGSSGVAPIHGGGVTAVWSGRGRLGSLDCPGRPEETNQEEDGEDDCFQVATRSRRMPAPCDSASQLRSQRQSKARRCCTGQSRTARV